MTVNVYCSKCAEATMNDMNDDGPSMMDLDGDLYRNNTYKLETQSYKCKRCNTRVSVSIDWKD